jgi:hypothetical protein
MPPADGDVAQLGEHLLCKEGVRGSSPLISTTFSIPNRRAIVSVLEGDWPVFGARGSVALTLLGRSDTIAALAGRPQPVILAIVVTSPKTESVF